MQKCRISSPARYGLEITSNTYSFRFQGDIGGAQQHGIVINGCRNVDVYDSLIHWNAKGGKNTYDNIHITGATRRATVHDCMIFSTKEPNDYLTTYGHHGIYIDTLVSGSNIHDNIIFDHNTDGICLKGGFNNVHNNEIYHNASVGIDIISGATKNRISHNNVYNNDIDILNGGTSTRLADNYSDF